MATTAKIAKDVKLDKARKASQLAKAANKPGIEKLPMPPPQPLLALWTAPRDSCASSEFAVSASASSP